MYFKTQLIICFLIFPFFTSKAIDPSTSAGNKVAVSGYIKDAKNGEVLVGATVYIKEKNLVTASNQYGFYSLSVTPGDYQIIFSYVGYKNLIKAFSLKEDQTFNIELEEEAQQLEEVVVKSEKAEATIKRPEMSINKLDAKAIKYVPAFMGETDLIKVIQMLPGVTPTSEGSSGFSVRGGGIDQNLIILDEATVYNASHLMGFFSVFNNDAIKDVKLYKGDIPAQFGGRLSSVLDVKMKEGNNKKFAVTGGVGLLSSRLTIEGPIIDETTSFLIAGRRTYYDIFFPLFPDTNLKKAILYFYDLNLKVNHQFDNYNRLFVSGYIGRDNFGQKGGATAGFGNKTATIRWNHQFSSLLFSNLTAVASSYNYSLKTTQGGDELVWNSNLTDFGAKADFNFYLNPENEIRFGASTNYHTIDPTNAWIANSKAKASFPHVINHEFEHAFYASNEEKFTDKLTFKYGIRYSIFQNIGPTTSNEFDANHKYLDSIYYPSRKIFNTYTGLEPRVGAIYSISNNSSVKASFARTFQYLQLASNSNGGMPLDYWFPASPNVKPQYANQFAIGYFQNLFDNQLETSVETFYKQMYNVIDFRDHAQLLFNDRLEGDIRSGKAKSYGIEFFIKKNEGKVTGWLSYTYSRALRQIAEINDGNEYPAPYDKPNVINLIVNDEINKQYRLSANWVYATGIPYTGPIGTFTYDNNTDEIYSGRNQSRMRDYHRLDLSFTIKSRQFNFLLFGKPHIWDGEWVFSIYNVYGRHNDWILNFNDVQDPVTKDYYKQAQRTFLPFVFFPGITYNFNF